MLIPFISGLSLAVLSALWARACASRAVILAALTEMAWAFALARGVGACGSLGSSVAFAIGTGVGTVIALAPWRAPLWARNIWWRTIGNWLWMRRIRKDARRAGATSVRFFDVDRWVQ